MVVYINFCRFPTVNAYTLPHHGMPLPVRYAVYRFTAVILPTHWLAGTSLSLWTAAVLYGWLILIPLFGFGLLWVTLLYGAAVWLRGLRVQFYLGCCTHTYHTVTVHWTCCYYPDSGGRRPGA